MSGEERTLGGDMTRLTVFAALLLTVLSAAAGRAEDPPADEFLPTPYTAGQIRAAWVQGLELDMRTTTPDGVRLQRWRVVAANHEGCAIEYQPLDATGGPAGEPEVGSSRWPELRDHARFPTSQARRERVERDTPLGRYAGWLYIVDDPEGDVTRFFFAADLPGAPLWMETTHDGTAVYTMEQVRRLSPAPPG